MSDTTSNTESGLTRRELLKKGAVLGGALVWAAPVVQVIGMRPALAANVSGCPNLYCVKAEWDEETQYLGPFTACSAGHNQGKGNCLERPEDVNPNVLGGITWELSKCPPDDPNGVDGILVTLPPNCDLAEKGVGTGSEDSFVGPDAISAAAKCGSKGSRRGVVFRACYAPMVGTDTVGNTTLCFPIECPNGTSISHIEILLCCG